VHISCKNIKQTYISVSFFNVGIIMTFLHSFDTYCGSSVLFVENFSSLGFGLFHWCSFYGSEFMLSCLTVPLCVMFKFPRLSVVLNIVLVNFIFCSFLAYTFPLVFICLLKYSTLNVCSFLDV
jgi:hypothetical protein